MKINEKGKTMNLSISLVSDFEHRIDVFNRIPGLKLVEKNRGSCFVLLHDSRAGGVRKILH